MLGVLKRTVSICDSVGTYLYFCSGWGLFTLMQIDSLISLVKSGPPCLLGEVVLAELVSCKLTSCLVGGLPQVFLVPLPRVIDVSLIYSSLQSKLHIGNNKWHYFLLLWVLVFGLDQYLFEGPITLEMCLNSIFAAGMLDAFPQALTYGMTMCPILFIRVNNPTLNRNTGKFQLSHIWNSVPL